MDINNAPFYPNQPIVRIKPDEYGGKPGDEHIAYRCEQCSKCKLWYVDIGKRAIPRSNSFASVCNCGNTQEMDEPIIWYTCRQFAPIQHQYTDISEEILEKFPVTEETPDKIIIPEKVNN